jgi:hypothetical protein
MRKLLLFMMTAFAVTACSKSIQQPEPSQQPGPEPVVEVQPKSELEKLTEIYGEPVDLTFGETRGQYVVVRAVYDANDNVQADPGEVGLADWSFQPYYNLVGNDPPVRYNPVKTGPNGGVLLHLRSGYPFSFSNQLPRAQSMTAAWTGTDNGMESQTYLNQPNAIQVVTMNAACRAAETGRVIPRPSDSNELRIWPCQPTRTQPNPTSATWRDLGDGIAVRESDSIGSFAIAQKTDQPMLTIAGSSARYVPFSHTWFRRWNGTSWEKMARDLNSYDTLDEAAYTQFDSQDRILISRYNQQSGRVMLQRWNGNDWEDQLVLGNETTYRQPFWIDSSDRVYRFFYGFKASEFKPTVQIWENESWQDLGPLSGRMYGGGHKIVFGSEHQVYALETGAYKYDKWNILHTYRSKNGTVTPQIPELPNSGTRSCEQVEASTSKLLTTCTVYVSPKENRYSATTGIQTISFYENGKWTTLSYGPNVDNIAFDSSERPIATFLEDGDLFVRRWMGDHWETLGASLNTSSQVKAVGGSKIAVGKDGLLYVAWIGEREGARRVYLSRTD